MNKIEINIEDLLKNIENKNDQYVIDILHNIINDNKITEFNKLLHKLSSYYVDESYKYLGYIYCVYHDTYKYYGENAHKIGCAQNIKERLAGYTTYYLTPIEIKFQSKKIEYYELVESFLFIKLKDYRFTDAREFFNCDVEIVKEKFNEIMAEIKSNNIYDLIINYSMNITKINNMRKIITNFIKNNRYKFPSIIPKEMVLQNNIDEIDEIANICNSSNLTEQEYLDICSNINDKLYEKQLYSLYKYIIMKQYPNNSITYDFVQSIYKDFNRKINRELLDEKSCILRQHSSWIIKKNMIIKIIEKIGFKRLDRESFMKIIQDIKNSAELFKNLKYTERLFNLDRKKTNISSIKQFMGFINSIIKDFGLCIKYKQTFTSISINNKKKTITSPYYSLNYLNDN